MNAATYAKPLASYSAARAVRIGPNLQLLYVSGTTARQPDGSVPPFGMKYDGSLHASLSPGASAAATQADIVISKIEAVIREVSGGTSGLEALVDLTVLVKDLKRDYGAVNEVYNSRVGALFTDSRITLPARTCVQLLILVKWWTYDMIEKEIRILRVQGLAVILSGATVTKC